MFYVFLGQVKHPGNNEQHESILFQMFLERSFVKANRICNFWKISFNLPPQLRIVTMATKYFCWLTRFFHCFLNQNCYSYSNSKIVTLHEKTIICFFSNNLPRKGLKSFYDKQEVVSKSSFPSSIYRKVFKKSVFVEIGFCFWARSFT